MSVMKALLTVAGTAAGFGLAGGIIGGLLGALAPSYYRHIFAVRDAASFNPTELGIGMGVTAGLIWGLVVGLLIVAIIAWKETRISRRDREDKAA
jgi:predicted DNA repair protein MutK